MSRSNYTEQVFLYISDEATNGHLAPTQREIADALYISRSTVQRCLSDLEDMGCIETIPGKARSLTIRRELNQSLKPDSFALQNATQVAARRL